MADHPTMDPEVLAALGGPRVTDWEVIPLRNGEARRVPPRRFLACGVMGPVQVRLVGEPSSYLQAVRDCVAKLPGVRVPQVYWQGWLGSALVQVEHRVPARSLDDLLTTGGITPSRALELVAAVGGALRSCGSPAEPTSEWEELFAAVEESPLPTRDHRRIRDAMKRAQDRLRGQWYPTNRDLTPGNILIDEAGGIPWLVDFDMARWSCLPWIDSLRVRHYSGLGLPWWESAWGDPDAGLAPLLFHLCEEQLQRQVCRPVYWQSWTKDRMAACAPALARLPPAESWGQRVVTWIRGKS